jgi:hypothetical protein
LQIIDEKLATLPTPNTSSHIRSPPRGYTKFHSEMVSNKSSQMDVTEEFNETVKKKYQLIDSERFMQLDFRERNKIFYKILSHNKVCVVPSQRIESSDKLPHFSIIESNLNDLKPK